MVFTPYPDFFIISNSQDLSLSKRLVLPSDYRKYYPTPLPQTAVLRKSEGNFWTVKWTLSQQDTTSFEDGWSKFITDNAPIDGDFLLFSYDGSQTFLVSIYRNGFPVKPKSPINIQEISDDGDGDQDMKEDEDKDQNMTISLSSDEDDVDTKCGEVNKAHESLRKGRRYSRKKLAEAIIGDPEMYLDDPSNPCVIANSTSGNVLVIPIQVINDYGLNFGGTIKFMDGFGELEAKIGNGKGRVVVFQWKEICKRNDAKPEDIIICEILCEGGVVRSIKVHFVKNRCLP